MAYLKFNIRLSSLGKLDRKFLLGFQKEFQKILWNAIGINALCFFDETNPKAVEIYKIPKGVYNFKKRKYCTFPLFTFSRDALLKAIKRADSDTLVKVLVITGAPLYKRNVDGPIFSDIECGNDIAIVSTSGMKGYPRGPKSIRQRLLKESLYLVGRMIGLPNCMNEGCAMKHAKNIDDIDKKNKAYCNDCLNRLYGGKI
ncbi:MAG TPA: hypothetical protein PLP47_06465 [Methanofastidiosum sp.]|nr:hypothetical protein [Methanofastidiosum sp.]HOG74544.1 hypothetical protein [Methanofastidiosum sp.]HPA49335.1 hypothetical protein [Methanofastidiosum sp.]HQM95327.1 hypothetical protein [Methanofastidiosum sp.]HQQ49419.1 hypothetical protein [Methanofastidiosum sp.]